VPLRSFYWNNRDGTPVVHLHFKTAGSQWNTICFGHIGMLESYFAQTLEVEGDFGQAFAVGLDSGFDRAPSPLVWIRNQWHEFRYSNRTIEQAKAMAINDNKAVTYVDRIKYVQAPDTACPADERMRLGSRGVSDLIRGSGSPAVGGAPVAVPGPGAGARP
jgi:hypothetical protein